MSFDRFLLLGGMKAGSGDRRGKGEVWDDG
jgi:hypothetical protein